MQNVTSEAPQCVSWDFDSEGMPITITILLSCHLWCMRQASLICYINANLVALCTLLHRVDDRGLCD